MTLDDEQSLGLVTRKIIPQSRREAIEPLSEVRIEGQAKGTVTDFSTQSLPFCDARATYVPGSS